MNANEEILVLKLVKDHFSKATDADARIVWEDIRGVSFDDARHAIEEHRRECGKQPWRPDPKRVKALAYERFKARHRANRQNERIVDWLRKYAAAANGGRIVYPPQMGDFEVIQSHFSDAWRRVKAGNASIDGKNAARAYIRSHAKQAAREIGLDEIEIEEFAAAMVELDPGQKIPKARVMSIELEQPPTSYSALQALAAESSQVQRAPE